MTETPKTHTSENTHEFHPIVFISYSWDNEEHKEWVLNLANRLRQDGIDAIIDRYHLGLGANLSFFVEESLTKCNRILVILSPTYKEKSILRKGGVGYEYTIINNHLLENIVHNPKVIPIIKSGDRSSSIPEFLKQYIYLDFTQSPLFESKYNELIREIYNEPQIVPEKLGKKPDWKTPTNPNRNNETENAIKNSDIENIKTELRKRISNDKIFEVIEILLKADNLINLDKNSVILLSARYKDLESKNIIGVLDSNESKIENNRIVLSILNLIDKL